MTTPLLPTNLRCWDRPLPSAPIGKIDDEINLVIESHILMGNFYKALQLIHQGLFITPQDRILRYLQAEVYFLCGFYEKAQVHFQALDEKDPCIELYLLHCENKLRPSIETATQIDALTTEYLEELGLPFEQDLYVEDLRRGNYDEVLAWIKEQPFHRLSYDLLLTQACIQLKKGETDACIENIKDLLAISSQNLIRRPFYSVTPGVRGWMCHLFDTLETYPIKVLLPFARLFSDFKEDELSVKLYREIVRRHPDEGFLHALTGLQEAIIGTPNWEEHFERALKLCQGNEKVEITFYYAQSYFARQEWDKCLARFETLEEIPQNANYFIVWGEAFLKKEDYNKGKECYKKALEIAPRQPLFWKGLGICESALGNHAKALECFNESLKIYSQHPTIYLLRSRTHWLLKHDASLIMADYRQACWFNPTTPDEILTKIRLLIKQREFKKALLEAGFLVFCEPNYSEAWWSLAQIHLDLGKDEEAKKALNRFFALVQKSKPSRHLTYVAHLIKMGAFLEARNHMKQHAWLTQRYPLGYAALYLETYRQEAAPEYQRELEKFLSKWPDSPLHLTELAFIKLRAKKFTQALADLKKVHKIEATLQTTRLIDWITNFLQTPQNHLTPYSDDPACELIRYAELFYKAWQKVKGPKTHLAYDVMANTPYRINILVLELFNEHKEWRCPKMPKKPLRELLDEEVSHLAYLLHSPLPGATLAARLTLFKAVKLTPHCPRHPYTYLNSLQNQASDPEAFHVLDLYEAYQELQLTPPTKPLQPLFEDDPEWMESIPPHFPHLPSLSDLQARQNAQLKENPALNSPLSK